MTRFSAILPFVLLPLAQAGEVQAQADLSDVEMAHVAVTANHTDIAYAHLALAFSENPAVREFAEVMIRDHSAVNEAVATLAAKLNVEAKDNALSRQLRGDAERIKNELSRLRGVEFDRRYAENELRYHQAVNELVEKTFIPNIENADVKQAFQQALAIFRGHERHAERMVSSVVATR